MGLCNSKEAEVSARQKKLNDDLDRIEKKEAEKQQRAEEPSTGLAVYLASTEKQQRAEEPSTGLAVYLASTEKQQRAEEAAEKQQRALGAETIPLNMSGPDGNFDHDARLNGTL